MDKNIESGEQDVIHDFDLPAKRVTKDQAAWAIGHHLLVTFRVALFAMLTLGFVALVCDIFIPKGGGESLVKNSIAPFLSALGTFIATTFGPLLAFVLGHYFGRKQ